jgi:hypothetical protein
MTELTERQAALIELVEKHAGDVPPPRRRYHGHPFKQLMLKRRLPLAYVQHAHHDRDATS